MGTNYFEVIEIILDSDNFKKCVLCLKNNSISATLTLRAREISQWSSTLALQETKFKPWHQGTAKYCQVQLDTQHC